MCVVMCINGILGHHCQESIDLDYHTNNNNLNTIQIIIVKRSFSWQYQTLSVLRTNRSTLATMTSMGEPVGPKQLLKTSALSAHQVLRGWGVHLHLDIVLLQAWIHPQKYPVCWPLLLWINAQESDEISVFIYLHTYDVVLCFHNWLLLQL